MAFNSRQFDQPLFISRDELKNHQTTPAVDLNAGNTFENIRRTGEKIKELEVPFLPKTSPLRYLPGELAGETFKAGIPQTPVEAGLMAIPFGTLAKPLAKTPLGKIAGAKIEKEIPRIFKGFKDLTTKFLEYAKGKTALSKQEIMDFARRPELKKGEADLLLKKLEEFEPKQNKVLELPRKGNTGTDNYYRISEDTYIHQFVDEKGKAKGFGIGKIANGKNFSPFEKTKIAGMDMSQNKNYSSFEEALQDAEKLANGKLKTRENGTNTELFNQIKTSLGQKSSKLPAQEFADSLRRDLLELKPVKVKEPQYQFTTVDAGPRRGGADIPMAKNYEEVVFESPITTNGSSHFPNSKNYFAHARGDEVVESGKKIWREQEIQSDLLQKEGMSRIREEQEYLRGTPPIQKTRTVEMNGQRFEVPTDEYKQALAEHKQKLTRADQLDPFTNDRFGERIMRERIKEKARKGYNKYRLPTGETIGKIEGFESPEWVIKDFSEYNTPSRKVSFEKLTPDNLKIGMRVDRGEVGEAGAWIITDILGDGRFKAVQKTASEKFTGIDGTISKDLKNIPESAKETFDLTGKSNPQYRRYEDWGKFLKNKYNGKMITDPQGNTWWEIDLKPEYGKAPIEAFGIGLGITAGTTPQQEDKQRIQFLHK